MKAEIINIKEYADEAVRERLETNPVKLSNIIPMERGAKIYLEPARNYIPTDEERLRHVDAAYEYLLKKSLRPKNLILAATLVLAGFTAGIIGGYLLNLYLGNIF